MNSASKPKYYLVEAQMLPEIFLKVMDAKELLQRGEADTVAEAAEKVGISRSAFYKYKDAISPFQDIARGHILTFHVMMRDHPGILSKVLNEFGESGANILTINQSIPVNGVAIITVSAETSGMEGTIDELMQDLMNVADVIKAEVLAG